MVIAVGIEPTFPGVHHILVAPGVIHFTGRPSTTPGFHLDPNELCLGGMRTPSLVLVEGFEPTLSRS